MKTTKKSAKKAHSIVTKQGDGGMTMLYTGKRVAKDSLRITVCGEIDELVSFLGLGKSLVKAKTLAKDLEAIQKDLFVFAAEVATPLNRAASLPGVIEEVFVHRLEALVDRYEKKPAKMKGCFCLPGTNAASCSLDIARTITRRIERHVVTLQRRKEIKNKYSIAYLNRLSDVLYLMARSCEKHASTVPL